MRPLFVIFATALLWINTSAQADYQVKDHIRKGNKFYQKEVFSDAELEYRKAMELDLNNVKAKYNFANSLYKSKKYKEAATNFEELKNNPDLSSEEKATVYHNLGNSYAKQEDWEKSYNAYKEALKLNPNDEETRYNLIYAQKHLKKSEQEQNQNKNQEQKQDQNKEQQEQKDKENQQNSQEKENQEKDSQNKEDQQSEGQNGDEKEDEKNQSQQNAGKEGDEKKGEEKPAMSMQEAKQLLKAIEEKDKKTAEKAEIKKAKANQVKVEKDW